MHITWSGSIPTRIIEKIQKGAVAEYLKSVPTFESREVEKVVYDSEGRFSGKNVSFVSKGSNEDPTELHTKEEICYDSAGRMVSKTTRTRDKPFND